jgi:hypothetical protein
VSEDEDDDDDDDDDDNNNNNMALQPNSGPGLPLWGFVTITF